GLRVWCVFTDVPRLVAWRNPAVPYLRVPGIRLVRVALSRNLGSIRINPGGDVGGELYRNELQQIGEAWRLTPGPDQLPKQEPLSAAPVRRQMTWEAVSRRRTAQARTPGRARVRDRGSKEEKKYRLRKSLTNQPPILRMVFIAVSPIILMMLLSCCMTCCCFCKLFC